jgi:hypothetical protein
MTRSRIRFGLSMAVLCTLLVPAVASGQSDDTYTRYGGLKDTLDGEWAELGAAVETPSPRVPRAVTVPADSSSRVRGRSSSE